MRKLQMLLVALLTFLVACGDSNGLYDFDGDGSLDAEDCNPQDPTIYPGQSVDCVDEGAVDNNCDGADGIDLDQDGFARPAESDSCMGGSDCNDSDASIHPAATEVPDNAIDENCDGVVALCDADGDGVLAESCGGTDCDDFSAACAASCDDIDGDGFRVCDGDCDDTNPLLNEGNPEICNGLDDDCNGYIPPDEMDYDGDGFAQCEGDCNDLDLTVAPHLPELCDELDNNCSGSQDDELLDTDGDGYPPCSHFDESGNWVEGEDCDDTDPANFAQNNELCDGQDNDCDPETDETTDGDGDTESVCDGDCDDSNPTVSTMGLESCDLEDLDQDCDGLIDQDDPDAAGCEWLSVDVGGSTSRHRSCGLRTDGTVQCWGQTSNGLDTVPGTGLTDIEVETACNFALGPTGALLTGGTSGSCSSFAPTTHLALLDMSWDYPCGIDIFGALACGYNQEGPPPTGSFVDLAVGSDNACAIDTEGFVECWGVDAVGETIPPPGTFVALAAWSHRMCGIPASGTSVVCWGSAGTGTGYLSLPEVPYQALSIGYDNGCALAVSGDLHCWDGPGLYNPSSSQFLTVASTYDWSCGVTVSNEIECWGNNTHGQATPP